jgi:hypothetical protein
VVSRESKSSSSRTLDAALRIDLQTIVKLIHVYIRRISNAKLIIQFQTRKRLVLKKYTYITIKYIYTNHTSNLITLQTVRVYSG